MKNLTTLFLLLYISVCIAQNPSINQERARFNRSVSLDLNTNATTWKKIIFNGTSVKNYNTYAINPISGLKMFDWDPVLEKFIVTGDYDSNVIVGFYPVTITTGLTIRSTLQFRIVIPNAGGPGINESFPYPEDGGYLDMGEVTLLSSGIRHDPTSLPLPITQLIRTNGFWIEVRLSNSIVALSSSSMSSCYITFLSTR